MLHNINAIELKEQWMENLVAAIQQRSQTSLVDQKMKHSYTNKRMTDELLFNSSHRNPSQEKHSVVMEHHKDCPDDFHPAMQERLRAPRHSGPHPGWLKADSLSDTDLAKDILASKQIVQLMNFVETRSPSSLVPLPLLRKQIQHGTTFP